MVNWSNPTLTQLWSDFVDAIKGRDVSAATMDFSIDTNLPTGALRYNRTTDRFEEWDGGAWVIQPIDVSQASGQLPGANIADNAVSNAKLADMTQATIKGRAAAAGTGDPQDMDAPTARTALGLGGAAVENVASGGVADLLRADGDGSSLTGLQAFPTGTRMIFQQTAAPTGWTKDTTANLNDTALRITTGTVGSITAQSAFSTVFNKTATDGHILTKSQLPNESVFLAAAVTVNQDEPNLGATDYIPRENQGSSNAGYDLATTATVASVGLSSPMGDGVAHTHPIDLRVNYHDVIVAVKD